MDLKKLLFPYEKARPIQEDLIKEVDKCIKLKKNIIVHAPTGLGKTAATLPIALSHAINKKKKVFFLTSRHTQHKIAIETLKEIKEKHNIPIIAVDIIGKQWMCPVPGTDTLYSTEFFEFCKQQREDEKCEFFTNTKKKSGSCTFKSKKALDEIKKQSPCSYEEFIKICVNEKLCPYETAGLLSKEADVIIADYYAIFDNAIRNIFLKRADVELEDCIVIIDEAHNLPNRIRNLMTVKLSDFVIKASLKESKKHGYEETANYLEALRDTFNNYLTKLKTIEQEQNENVDEVLIKKEDFINQIKLIGDYDELITNFEFTGDEIREKQKKSFTGSIAHFLQTWLGQDEAFARILAKKEANKPSVNLSYRCLDPSIFSTEIVNKTHSTILMSGTLTPTSMYQEILGFDPELTIQKEYLSPFPTQNKLSLIVPQTTTKYTMRSPEQYKRIAQITSTIVNEIPGNTAIFFPSYYLRDEVNKFFQPLCQKTIFYEAPMLSKTEKEELLDKFKAYKDSGAVLLGVAAGSFSQGVDLPGDLLKGVIVVGLPLQKPDLETKELIDYYDKKFQKGWDYGYVFPAITKTLQSAGRCIRSETDRGVMIFLDERFAWPMYSKYFPKDLNTKITKMYMEKIMQFF